MKKIILCLALAAAIPFPVRAADPVLAVIGGEPVTAARLGEELDDYGRAPSLQHKLLAQTPDGKKQIFKDLLRQKLFLRAARDEGLALDPREERRLERLRESLLVKAYLDRALAARPIAEGDLRAYYDTHRERFTAPAQRRVRHIVVKTPGEAEALLARIGAGADFAALAAESNIDASKAKRGDLGWIRRGAMVKAFDEAAFSLGAGETSGVVTTSFGSHLIRVEEIKPVETREFDRARDEARAALEAERLQAVGAQLEKKYGLTVDAEALEKYISTNTQGGTP